VEQLEDLKLQAPKEDHSLPQHHQGQPMNLLMVLKISPGNLNNPIKKSPANSGAFLYGFQISLSDSENA
jgi:hypothetical protein